MASHLAAVSHTKGEPFKVQNRPTPKPGPGELLVAVKAVALNPADHLMRGGRFIPTYPTVIGFDMAGLVLDVGDNVPSSRFLPGITRVAAYASFLWRSFGPDYGAFQERCLIPWQHAALLPQNGLSWKQAATLPVAVQVALNAWDIVGIPLTKGSFINPPDPFIGRHDHKIGAPQQVPAGKTEALLVWGASSSVGTMGVQTARLLRDDANSPFTAVYATAGRENLNYVASLGANHVFDYKAQDVAGLILSAAHQDNVVIRHCFLANGDLEACQAVLRAFVDVQGEANARTGKIASAPLVPEGAEEVHGLETIFVYPSTDENERLSQFQYWMGTWLSEALVEKSIRPSPEFKVVGRGLNAINTGLDMLQEGVSCTKLVVELDE